jgi:hypothetical protein
VSGRALHSARVIGGRAGALTRGAARQASRCDRAVQRAIFLPDHRLRLAWDALVFGVVLMSVFLYPYELAFLTEPVRAAEVVIVVVFFADIVLTFFVAIEVGGTRGPAPHG